MIVNVFTAYLSRQLKRELAYQRQFSGVKGANYHRAYCQEIVRELRKRGF